MTNLKDFDGGEVGAFFSDNILSLSNNAVAWSRGDQVDNLESLQRGVTEERTWVAVVSGLLSIYLALSVSPGVGFVVNAGTSSRLSQGLQSPNPSYNGSLAISVYVDEARNENA